MLLALTTGHKIGLAGVGAAFILFALVSSFVLPSRDPNFPGERRNLYVAICVCFFIAMMAAVLVFGKEPEEEGAEAATPTTETQTTGTQPTETGGGDEYGNGNAAAGKTVFTSKGCGACHVLSDAGASGAVGPNLDEAKPDHELIVDR